MPPQNIADWWCEPASLITSLHTLADGGPASHWAAAVLQQIQALGPAIAVSPDKAMKIVDRLDALTLESESLAKRLSDEAFVHKWHEVGFSLARRVDVWRQVVLLRKLGASDAVSPKLNPKQLTDRLAKVEAMMGDAAGGEAWRTFLLIDELKACACARRRRRIRSRAKSRGGR